MHFSAQPLCRKRENRVKIIESWRSQVTWVLSYLSHCVIILNHLPSLEFSNFANKQADLPSAEFFRGKSNVLERAGWKVNEPVFPCLPLFLLGWHVDHEGVKIHSKPSATGQGEGLFLELGWICLWSGGPGTSLLGQIRFCLGVTMVLHPQFTLFFRAEVLTHFQCCRPQLHP